MSQRIQTTHKSMMVNKPIKKSMYVRLGNYLSHYNFIQIYWEDPFQTSHTATFRGKNSQPNLTLILIGFMTFLVIAPGDLSRMASKVHHLMEGIFFRSSSETSSLSLPVTARERRLHVKIRFRTCFDTG